MSDVKLCDCCGMHIVDGDVSHTMTMSTDNGERVIDICAICAQVICETPFARIRKVRRERKAKA